MNIRRWILTLPLCAAIFNNFPILTNHVKMHQQKSAFKFENDQKNTHQKKQQDNLDQPKLLSQKHSNEIGEFDDFISNASTIGKITELFDQTFEYSKHHLSTQDKRWVALEVALSKVKEIIPKSAYNFLTATMDGNNEEHIINNSELVPTGDWFDINWKIGETTKKIRFKVKHVGCPELDGFEKLQADVKKPFSYIFHEFSTVTKRRYAYQWIRDRINRYFDSGILTSVDFYGDENAFLINNSRMVDNGDWINCVVRAGSTSKEIMFKFKNISKPELDFLENLKENFDKQLFQFRDHHLSTSSTRDDAFKAFKRLIALYFPQQYSLLQFTSPSNPKGFVIDNSPEVPTGDWIDVPVSYDSYSQVVRFKFTNVGKEGYDFLDSIEYYFSRIFDNETHNFSIFSTLSEIQALVERLLNKHMSHEVYQLISLTFEQPNSYKVQDNNSDALYNNGDTITFKVNYKYVFEREMVLKISDVKNFSDLIVNYFANYIPFRVHQLSSSDNELTVKNLFEKLVNNIVGAEKFQLLTIEFKNYQDDLIENKYANGQVSYNFSISFADKELNIFFKLSQIRNWLQIIEDHFQTTFDFFDHFLDAGQSRIVAFETAKEIIKKLVGIHHFPKFSFEFISPEGTIINDSAEVPTGDWFDMKVTLGNTYKLIKFKVKNVGLQHLMILQAIKNIFTEPLIFSEHNLTSSSRVHDVYAMFYNKIKHLFGTTEAQSITINFERNWNDTVATSSNVVPDGDFFKITLIKSGHEIQIILKLAQVKNENVSLI